MTSEWPPLTDEERKILGDTLGQLATFFMDSNRALRDERDAAIARAEKAELWLKRLRKPDGEVRETAVAS